MLGAVLQALVEPARALGVPSLPQRLLDVVAPDKVGGRRAWVSEGKAAVEVAGVGDPDSAQYAGAVEQCLQRHPGVAWARVNAPLGRVIVGLDLQHPAPVLSLVEALDELDRDRAVTRGRAAPAGSPVDRAPVERAVVTLAADLVGLASAGLWTLASLAAPLPSEVASVVTAVDTVPSVRSTVETLLGGPAADTAMAVANAVAQGLARGVVGLGVDAAYRLLTLREALSNASAWHEQRGQLLANPDTAGSDALAGLRCVPLAAGPVERWADLSGAIAAGAFATALPATGSARRAAGVALSALPKAARLGREGFAAQLSCELTSRGAIVMDPAALRLLDRVSTVVLDEEVLDTGRHVLTGVYPMSGADPKDVLGRAHTLFRPERPRSLSREADWELGEVDGTALRGVPPDLRAELRRQQTQPGVVLLGLRRAGRLVAVCAVSPETHESLEGLAAAAHQAGRRLVLAGGRNLGAKRIADTVLPGGAALLGTVQALQADGQAVLLISSQSGALAAADVGVGVIAARPCFSPRRGRHRAQEDERRAPAVLSAPWGAHVFVRDLFLAALLIRGCGVAAAVSRRSVSLAQGATAVGAVATTATTAAIVAPRALLAINTAAAAALAHGVWAARQAAAQPLTPPVSRVAWHAMPADVVLARLRTSKDGLSTQEARRRLGGSNRVTAAEQTFVRAVTEELANPLTPILLLGSALAAAVGSLADAALVTGVTLASAVVGGAQRVGTDRALEQLLEQSAVTARVRRHGQEHVVPADQLVPGDLVLLGAGDVVPADCRVVSAVGLEADESSLTGEPFPVTKTVDPVTAATVAERTCMVYEGTTIAAGRALVAVVATGAGTEAGRSIAATREGAPPGGVQARLEQITRVTLPASFVAAGTVVAAGLLRGRPVTTTVAAAISLAVAAVPEGLPFIVTAAELAAARRLSMLGALVRHPRAIEALGRVDVLCIDKTGTLTEGRMALSAVLDAEAHPRALDRLDRHTRRVLATALRATFEQRAGQPRGHLTDRAVTAAAAAAKVSRATGAKDWRPVGVLPFESSRGFHATLGTTHGHAVLCVKGAPEVVLARCTSARSRSGEAPIDDIARRRLASKAEALGAQGYRVLAVATRHTAEPQQESPLQEEDAHQLSLQGFLAFSDPLRPAATVSVQAMRAAGMQLLMITGDHPSTATVIAQRLDLLRGGRVLTGAELDQLDDAALAQVLPHVAVVARSTPAHKVRVVQAFQSLRRTVAMTGDGANDAAAIRLADVGLALGQRGTPAARAAADLVVTDDRLDTIIAALLEGRAMWGSVRKALGILVGGNLGEIAFVLIGALLTGASPLTARQLLLVNLLTDLAPALSVALKPPSASDASELLTEGPEASLGAALTRDVTTRAVTTTASATLAWALAGRLGLGPAAPTVALATLVATQLGQTLLAGGGTDTVLRSSLGSLGALGLAIQIPALSAFFGSVPLGPAGWLLAATVTTAALFVPAASTLLPLARRALAPQPSTPTSQPTMQLATPGDAPALSAAGVA